ncbi:hypothetical protein STSP2_00915 [Anaerohalosphaera lusitana]|uniref:Uncharacterized protein n=1 Tax=Anaerohalosphaera lusitana TaxID=1936003 RepID=A0A1U9NJT0_9BACT|nr:hypothetical protein [Anaerohalosphaera lusitana]AQT67766.1 hypothetical protein STSP2_00915 [Anaerohalosphaera lusitana]
MNKFLTLVFCFVMPLASCSEASDNYRIEGYSKDVKAVTKAMLDVQDLGVFSEEGLLGAAEFVFSCVGSTSFEEERMLEKLDVFLNEWDSRAAGKEVLPYHAKRAALIRFMASLDDNAKAKQTPTDLLELCPDNGFVWMIAAEDAWRKGEWTECKNSCEKAFNSETVTTYARGFKARIHTAVQEMGLLGDRTAKFSAFQRTSPVEMDFLIRHLCLLNNLKFIQDFAYSVEELESPELAARKYLSLLSDSLPVGSLGIGNALHKKLLMDCTTALCQKEKELVEEEYQLIKLRIKVRKMLINGGNPEALKAYLDDDIDAYVQDVTGQPTQRLNWKQFWERNWPTKVK